MVDRCINPACGEKWRLFSTGEVYALEIHAQNTEFFWLCPRCALRFAVRLDSSASVVVIPRSEATHAQLPNRNHDLRLIFRFPSPQKSRAVDKKPLVLVGPNRRTVGEAA